MIGVDAIKRIIPHRHPILLVDRVLSVEPGVRLTALKAVTAAEPCYADVPDDADHAYPSSLLIESWAQSAVLLAVWEQPNPDVLAGKVELAGAINDIRFERPVHPGEVLRHEVRMVRAVADTAILAGETTADGATVMSVGHFVVALRPIEALGPVPQNGRVKETTA
ncbi:3-hydroxyacyl-ACP dehydratase FabZ family protein [Actinomadura sp. 1N219]|uniref:3-hydroxyacyl-ACP dehydratase FabZ family protein n=1 Tax=Actinomadura sp. 1N219 TaxID=3375152 RepID=UPI0037BBA6EF